MGDLIPLLPDPDKNGASLFEAAALHMNSAVGALQSNTPPAMRTVAPGKAMIGWQQPEVLSPDNHGFITNSWNDIQLALQSQASTMDLLRQTAERPQLVFECGRRHGNFYFPLHNLAMILAAALLLSPAAVAALHRGDSAAAVTNIHSLVALVNAWKEPSFIAQLVRVAMVQIAVNRWLSGNERATNLSDQQLAILQKDWTDLDFCRNLESALLMERTLMSTTIQQLRTSNSPAASMYSGYSGLPPSSGSSGDWLEDLKDLGRSAKLKTAETLWRVSWSYSDELASLQGDQILVETIRQIQTNGFFKDAFAERDRKFVALGLDRRSTNWLRSELDDELTDLGSVQSLSHMFDRVLAAEATRRMTITSIALKRYQLRHAKLPPDLNALVPEFLPQVPRDPVDGHPLRYQVTADDTFLLYSIGTDGVDNGGDPTTTKSPYWLRGRDWVWPQPASPQEIQHYYANPSK